MDKTNKGLLDKLRRHLGNHKVEIRESFKCGECSDCRYVGDGCDWNGEDMTYIQWSEVLPDGSWWYPHRDGCYSVNGKYTNTGMFLKKLAEMGERITGIENLTYALERTDPSKAVSKVVLEEDNLDLVEPDNKLFRIELYYIQKAWRERTDEEILALNELIDEEEFQAAEYRVHVETIRRRAKNRPE